MPVVLLLVVILVSFVVVRIGAVALELTGMPWENAKFQALSAFSNAGFTTKAAEEIVQHPLRRKIAGYLIILGNAGLVTTIGTFASSLVAPRAIESLMNVGAIVIGAVFVAWLSRRPAVTRKIRILGERYLGNAFRPPAPSAVEMLRLDKGYRLSKIRLHPESPVVGKKLAELQLNRDLIQVLSIERGDDFLPTPGGDEKLVGGDLIVIYGSAPKVESVFRPEELERLDLVPATGPQIV